MAMLTIKKLIGFLKLSVLYTIIAIKEFPSIETTNIRQKAKVIPILAAAELNGMEQLDPFTVVFMFADLLIVLVLISNSSGFSGSSVPVFMLNDK